VETTTRAELRREVEATRDAFHRLLAEVPDAALPEPSDNPAWTIREVLFHMSMAPRLMVSDVALIMHGPWLVRLLPRLIPRAAFDWCNKVYTRHRGRRMSRRALGAEYDRATATILRTLARVDEADLSRSAVYPGWDPLLAGEVTLARLFHYVQAHFETHAAQIRSRLREV
jgi:uncharacterized damage-inducible protein DinB